MSPELLGNWRSSRDGKPMAAAIWYGRLPSSYCSRVSGRRAWVRSIGQRVKRRLKSDRDSLRCYDARFIS